ncbi:MAG: prepilin-type N-terminal cleavage/methylation domain-containing protein [Deltaproteobacteria bacterium]|nr:prepilin-type N-terminal cleavage/methylation domain-containing protein [Deltaproteobacteria bacterium]
MKRPAAGFTLIEVLVALTVAAMVMGMVYGVVRGVSSAKQELEHESDGFHQARVLFGRMSREIRSVYFVADRPETLLRGGLDDNNNFFLELTTTATSPSLPVAAGISRVRYEMRADPDIAPPLLLLVRQEWALLPGGDAGEMESRLSNGVYAFRLRFFDGKNWQDKWDTARQGRLPRMIEMYLEIEVAGKRLPFMTTVAVPQVMGV